MLQLAHHLEDLPKPSMKSTMQLMRHVVGLGDHPRQLEEEDAWMYDPKDLVCLAVSEDTIMENLLVAVLQLCNKLVSSTPQDGGQPKLTDVICQGCRSGTAYIETKHIHRMNQCFMVFLIISLLVIPLFLLHFLTEGEGVQENLWPILGTMMALTIAFSLVIKLCTKAKLHENFMATVG
jgi:hypothetical protein